MSDQLLKRNALEKAKEAADPLNSPDPRVRKLARFLSGCESYEALRQEAHRKFMNRILYGTEHLN